jgi:uncharacterized protein with NRDE domain
MCILILAVARNTRSRVSFVVAHMRDEEFVRPVLPPQLLSLDRKSVV